MISRILFNGAYNTCSVKRSLNSIVLYSIFLGLEMYQCF